MPVSSANRDNMADWTHAPCLFSVPNFRTLCTAASCSLLLLVNKHGLVYYHRSGRNSPNNWKRGNKCCWWKPWTPQKVEDHTAITCNPNKYKQNKLYCLSEKNKLSDCFNVWRVLIVDDYHNYMYHVCTMVDSNKCRAG